VLSSPTGDATRVGEWASYTFNAIYSLNTLEEHERYPSQLARPSGNMNTLGGVGEISLIVVADEQKS
jgi:hypothetical protein